MPDKFNKLYKNLTVDERMHLISDLVTKTTIDKQNRPSLMTEIHKIKDSTPQEQAIEYNSAYNQLMSKNLKQSNALTSLIENYLQQRLIEAQKLILYSEMKNFVVFCFKRLEEKHNKKIDFRDAALLQLVTPEIYEKYAKSKEKVKQNNSIDKLDLPYDVYEFFLFLLTRCEDAEEKLLSEKEQSELQKLRSHIQDSRSVDNLQDYVKRKDKLLFISSSFDMKMENIFEEERIITDSVMQSLEFDEKLKEAFHKRLEKSIDPKISDIIYKSIEDLMGKYSPAILKHVKEIVKS